MSAIANAPSFIRFDRVCLTYDGTSGRAPVDVLKNVDFEIGAGEFVSFIGPSGCGKSTLLTLLAGYLAPSSGTVSMDRQMVSGPGPERMMVFQHPALFPWLTAAGNIAYGMRLKAHRRAGVNVKAALASSLKQVQLEDFANYYPAELSGGMQQRIEIARALVVGPQVLLMDEPLGGLDALTRRTMQREVLRIWQETRKTILFVTHDIDEAIIMSDRIFVMAPRPTHVRKIFDVSIPRPRLRDNPEVAQLSRHLAELLD